MVPIQVKTYSSTGYNFMKSWLDVAPCLVLVSVWHVATTLQCHVFGSIADVEDALGRHAKGGPGLLEQASQISHRLGGMTDR